MKWAGEDLLGKSYPLKQFVGRGEERPSGVAGVAGEGLGAGAALGAEVQGWAAGRGGAQY